MFEKETWKYFLFFLLLVGISLGIYYLYKWIKPSPKEGFQSYVFWETLPKTDYTAPYPNEIRIGELTTWNLSLPPEFETQKQSWDSGWAPHLYIGTLSAAQQNAIKAAEEFYWNISLGFIKRGGNYSDYRGDFPYYEFFVIDTNRIIRSNDYSFFLRAVGNPISGWVGITAKDLRRLNPDLADVIVKYMYENQASALKGLESLSWKDAWTTSQSNPFITGDDLEDKIQSKAYSAVSSKVNSRLINNKKQNNYITTYVTLEAANSDAAKQYLASEPEVQSYLDQVGAVIMWQAIGEAAGPALELVGKSLSALRTATPRAARATGQLIKAVGRLDGPLIKSMLSSGPRNALIQGLAKIKYARSLVSAGRLTTNITKGLGNAARAARAAIVTNPLGLILGLVDFILSLIPERKWAEWGEDKANDKISARNLKCPIGYIDGTKLDPEMFSGVLDLLPIPSGFGTMQKAMSKKLSCVAFDADGNQDIKDKVTCANTGLASTRTKAFNTGLTDNQYDTCFVDPDPPMQLYPPEPIPPTYESVEEIFANLAASMSNDIASVKLFPLTGSATATLATLYDSSIARVNAAQSNMFLSNASNISTVSGTIYSDIRNFEYITPLNQYNSTAKVATDILSAGSIPPDIERNYDVYYDDTVNTNAFFRFASTLTVGDRITRTCYMMNTTYTSTILSELTQLFKYDIYTMKLAQPDIFSSNDTTVYPINIEETAVHTLFLSPFRTKLSTYVINKMLEADRYEINMEEYNNTMAAYEAELGSLTLNAELFDRCAQYIYEESYRISSGKTATLIDKIKGCVIICDNLITLICDISCINREKASAGNPWRQPTVRNSDWDYWKSSSIDDNVGIEIYLANVSGVWTPTAWGRPVPNLTKPSLAFNYVVRRISLDYVPTINYIYTVYHNTKCDDPKELQKQLDYYKEQNPNKNIKAIVGQKTKDKLNCVMQWTETDYNPEENTESAVSNKTAIFTYESPNTPYPFNPDGSKMVDAYLGYKETTTETGILSINPPLVQPARGLPPERTLRGPCNNRCTDTIIMKAIMDKYNGARDPDGGTSKIVNIKKIFTAKENRCDFVANVNTGRGLVEEQRRRANITLLTSTPTCTYSVDSIGAKDSGTFISLTEGFTSFPAPSKELKEGFQTLTSNPYPGYFYQSTTINSATVPKYNFGDTILGSVVGGIQNTINTLLGTGNTARLKTYGAIGANNTLDGCPTTKCSSDEIVREIATKYNIDNWGVSRMTRILKATTAGPLECDIEFEDSNISGSNRFVNFADPRALKITEGDNVDQITSTYRSGTNWVNMSNVIYTMRFTMRKIPNTCKFETTSYKFMKPTPTSSELDDLTKKPFTANRELASLPSPLNTSSMIGCGQVNECMDNNTLVDIVKHYKQNNPSNSLDKIIRVVRRDRTTCTVEFSLNNRIRDYQGSNAFNAPAMVKDTFNYTFASDPTTCIWGLTGGSADTLDGLQATKLREFGSRGLNYTPGESIYMNDRKISTIFSNNTYGINANTLQYITPTCPGTLPALSCFSQQVRTEAMRFYNFFTGHTITKIVASANVNTTTCEFKVETTRGTSFEETHLQFTFIPAANCAGYRATNYSLVSKANSYTEGWMRPENTSCYPVNCDSTTIKTLTSNYYASQPGAWQKGENAIIFKKTQRVNSKTCEYQVQTNSYQQLQGSAFNSNAHKSVSFQAVGAPCEYRVSSASNITVEANSLTFKMPFSCPPSFNPMLVFTGSSGITNSNTVRSAIRQLYLNSNIFSGLATAANSFDTINGPSIRSDGIRVQRGQIIPGSTSTMRVEYEVKIRAYLGRPNSVSYPFTLSLAKLGTLITAAANQVDWNDFDNQFPINPSNIWIRAPPSEFRQEGVYEFAQSNFTTWQPIFHPTLEIQFPTFDCENPSIVNGPTNTLYNLGFIATRAESILP
jgi:hypothetical protein